MAFFALFVYVARNNCETFQAIVDILFVPDPIFPIFPITTGGNGGNLNGDDDSAVDFILLWNERVDHGSAFLTSILEIFLQIHDHFMEDLNASEDSHLQEQLLLNQVAARMDYLYEIFAELFGLFIRAEPHELQNLSHNMITHVARFLQQEELQHPLNDPCGGDMDDPQMRHLCTIARNLTQTVSFTTGEQPKMKQTGHQQRQLLHYDGANEIRSSLSEPMELWSSVESLIGDWWIQYIRDSYKGDRGEHPLINERQSSSPPSPLEQAFLYACRQQLWKEDDSERPSFLQCPRDTIKAPAAIQQMLIKNLFFHLPKAIRRHPSVELFKRSDDLRKFVDVLFYRPFPQTYLQWISSWINTPRKIQKEDIINRIALLEERKRKGTPNALDDDDDDDHITAVMHIPSLSTSIGVSPATSALDLSYFDDRFRSSSEPLFNTGRRLQATIYECFIPVPPDWVCIVDVFVPTPFDAGPAQFIIDAIVDHDCECDDYDHDGFFFGVRIYTNSWRIIKVIFRGLLSIPYILGSLADFTDWEPDSPEEHDYVCAGLNLDSLIIFLMELLIAWVIFSGIMRIFISIIIHGTELRMSHEIEILYRERYINREKVRIIEENLRPWIEQTSIAAFEPQNNPTTRGLLNDPAEVDAFRLRRTVPDYQLTSGDLYRSNYAEPSHPTSYIPETVFAPIGAAAVGHRHSYQLQNRKETSTQRDEDTDVHYHHGGSAMMMEDHDVDGHPVTPPPPISHQTTEFHDDASLTLFQQQCIEREQYARFMDHMKYRTPDLHSWIREHPDLQKMVHFRQFWINQYAQMTPTINNSNESTQQPSFIQSNLSNSHESLSFLDIVCPDDIITHALTHDQLEQKSQDMWSHTFSYGKNPIPWMQHIDAWLLTSSLPVTLFAKTSRDILYELFAYGHNDRQT